ncbi:MAG: PilZ domain-containing protein [Gammaproteobacteria bacterium]|nr:PilZ domain-containing protein [Gammaproteobacteria bacterium]
MRSTRDHRRHVRVDVPIDCSCQRLTTRQIRLFDISLGGARAYSESAPSKDEILEIELLLPSKKRLKCLAKVIWVNRLPGETEATKYEVGMQFIDLGGEDLVALAYQIKSISLG